MEIAIVGAGFGGMSAAKALSGVQGLSVQVLDRRNHHLFQPLLYQVAMAGLNPSDIAMPIRSLLSQSANIKVILTEVDAIDVKGNRILFDGQWKKFDYIILACGVQHSYFGNSHWEELAPGLKNLEQAIEIRRRVLTSFELAEKELDAKKREAYLTFVIIGGGPTGVELAGALAEMAKKTLAGDFKFADLRQTRVILIEAGPQILSSFPSELSERAERDLEELGVRVLKNTKATDLSVKGLRAGSVWIRCRTMIWAAGVTSTRIAETLETKKDPSGRLQVQADLSLPHHRNIFVIGDASGFIDKMGRGLPGVAPVALQQGRFVASVIQDDLRGRPRRGFVYSDAGMMATIGRSRALVSVGHFQMTGLAAWLVWVFVHMISLMGFKRKVFVFFQWTWGYFTFGNGARLITHRSWRLSTGRKLRYR